MWIPPEDKDPVRLHYPTRKNVGFFGAVRIRDGKFTYEREENTFNAETFFSFMKHLRRISSHARRKVVVIADNARYHHARLHKKWRAEAEKHFAVEFLPPYSPDLNPVERVWKLTRRLATHNRYFPELQDLINAVEYTFDGWTNGNDTLRKLCAII